ncbi:antibiotic biosynthesis monooxygenase family protein [Stigmatella aurantiaca]|uniref:Antibiotic biosynthesis monooxygenase domain protein n=1 Tax=Stigmatella aurantiaca (strain DW4/3-1) TaxID=378806 RepID=Q09CQ8_STIAD|nr:antibiotic biosynthesis monooxygenase family protein [Stigmatella aurantiaca]ADO70065.1 Antibiotic biosynthesis monooxygenase family protein [Stigmatella aurantiaca DW4/3-1]EAU69583.1 antibiotic biosynthesis monooxygenase domain protein [Stigmatella aurantiaca DW4/3-1]
MIVAISRFRPPEDQLEPLVARLQGRSRLVDRHEGFLGLEVLRSFERQPEFLLITRWRDKEALKAYLQSEDFQAAKAAGGVQADATFAMYEVVAQ